MQRTREAKPRQFDDDIDLSTPAEITEEHVRWAYAAAHRIWYNYTTFDLDSMISDALYGLWIAHQSHDPERGPFQPWAYLKMRAYIFNGIRQERTYRRILNPVLLSNIERVRQAEIHDPGDPNLAIGTEEPFYDDISTVAEDYDMLMALLRALRNERAMVVEAVLRTMPDADIARKYGVGREVRRTWTAADGTVHEFTSWSTSAITAARKTFLRRFFESQS